MSAANEATLRVSAGDLIGPLLNRVVGMLAARADCPVDKLDDAMLVSDALAAHAPQHSDDGWTCVHVTTDESGLGLDVGPLVPKGADGLVAAAVLPGVGNVFERVADEVRVEDDRVLIRFAFGA